MCVTKCVLLEMALIGCCLGDGVLWALVSMTTMR